MTRKRLPATRPIGVTHKTTIAGIDLYITVNCFPDGTPGELYIKTGGREHQGWCNVLGELASVALQAGATVNLIASHLEHHRFPPDQIGVAKSIPDYIGRWLRERFIDAPVLTLHLKAEYFDAIAHGEKLHEYRLANDYWHKRLSNRTYSRVVLCKGYPHKRDTTRRLTRPWRGATSQRITHPHFGPNPVQVFAIPVNDGGQP